MFFFLIPHWCLNIYYLWKVYFLTVWVVFWWVVPIPVKYFIKTTEQFKTVTIPLPSSPVTGASMSCRTPCQTVCTLQLSGCLIEWLLEDCLCSYDIVRYCPPDVLVWYVRTVNLFSWRFYERFQKSALLEVLVQYPAWVFSSKFCQFVYCPMDGSPLLCYEPKLLTVSNLTGCASEVLRRNN